MSCRLNAGFGGTDINFRSEEDDEAFAVRYQFTYLGAYASFSF